MHRNQQSRRDVLRLGSAAAGTAVATSLAGCLDLDELGMGGGGLGLGGSVDMIDDWTFGPRSVLQNHLFVNYSNASVIDEYRLELGEYYDNATWIEDRFPGVRYPDLDEVLGISHFTTIAHGDWDEDDVIQRLRDHDYVRAEDFEEYQIFERGSEALSVSEDTIIHTSAIREYDHVEIARIAIDTSNGDEITYAEESDDFETLLDNLDGGDVMLLGTHDPTEERDPDRGNFRNNVSIGGSIQIGETTCEMQVLYGFLDERDADERDVDTYVSRSDDLGRLREVEVEADGEFVEVTGTFDTRDMHRVWL